MQRKPVKSKKPKYVKLKIRTSEKERMIREVKLIRILDTTLQHAFAMPFEYGGPLISAIINIMNANFDKGELK